MQARSEEGLRCREEEDLGKKRTEEDGREEKIRRV